MTTTGQPQLRGEAASWQWVTCEQLRGIVWDADPDTNRDAVIGIVTEIVAHNRQGGWRRV